MYGYQHWFPFCNGLSQLVVIENSRNGNFVVSSVNNSNFASENVDDEQLSRPVHKQTQGVILDLSTSQLHLALLKETIENSKTIVLSILLKFLVCVLFNIISECTI